MRTEITSVQATEILRRATHDVFETMLGVTPEERAGRQENSPPDPAEGVLALIGIAGDWVGTGTISGSAGAARFLAGKFLMQEFAEVDEEVVDAIGELSNMVFGNVKTMLEEQLGPMGLSIPTVICGCNLTTRSVGNHAWTVAAFEVEGHRLELRICFRRRERSSTPDRLAASLPVLG
ncbi:MAG: chemotaxis protein CheX [Bryobacterales bacterium]|nr:chemotaxis protein CheX [Bryobacterales bacterium]